MSEQSHFVEVLCRRAEKTWVATDALIAAPPLAEAKIRSCDKLGPLAV
jgi:hypothetical protein